MSEPFFSPASRRDLLEILNYIAKDKPGAAIDFVDRLERECWHLAKHPEIATARDDLLPNLRCWSVGKYVICFRKAEDDIEIVRVVHGARDFDRLFHEPH